jgi:flagellar biosynthetic protein FlhB
VFLTLGAHAARDFVARFLIYLEQPDAIVLGAGGAADLFRRCVFGLIGLLAAPMLLLMLAGLGGHLLQGGLTFSAEKIKPDLSRLSPLKGVKRLFGLDGLVNFGKGIAKLGVVGLAAFLAVWPERARLATALSMDPSAVAGLAMTLAAKVLLAALVVLAAIAAFDYFYQRQRFFGRQRMTRQELRDEMKQSEGDPQVKARIRQIRHERAARRMMAKVPEATVIIANPTHYAVALRYESGKMGAPVCVAKGVDEVALRIREVAREHEVPIVENPPLARALYASVELDAEIPSEHYKAVAGVIGYVLRLARDRAFWKS